MAASTDAAVTAAQYNARTDRLPTFGLSYWVLLATAFSFYITLMDVTNVGVALPFIISSTSFLSGTGAASLLTSVGLFFYIPGAIIFGYAGDRYGRRPVLITTAILAAIGNLGDALAYNFVSLLFFRILVSMAIGADIVLATTYLTEVLPAAVRTRWLNIQYIVGFLGGTTPGVVMPYLVTGLGAGTGWRVLFGLGFLIAFSAVLMRTSMPETVRHMVKVRRFDEAEKIVSGMEQRAMKRAHLQSLPEPKLVEFEEKKENPFKKIFSTRIYLKRFVGQFIGTFFWYWNIFMVLSLLLTWMSVTLSYPTGLFLEAVTFFGIATGIADVLGLLVIRPVVHRIDMRAVWVIGTVIFFFSIVTTIYGAIIQNIWLFGIPFIISGMGSGMANQGYYTLSAEIFPTSSRGTGFAMADGVGHIGAVISLSLLFPMIAIFGNFYGWVALLWETPVFTAIAIYLLVPKTTRKTLEEISEAATSPSTKQPPAM